MQTLWLSAKGKRLPNAGEVFLAPLGKGLLSFCWVAGHAEHLNGGDFITYAFAAWVGKKAPLPEDLAKREVLVIQQPGADHGQPYVRKLSQAPPKSWKALGTISDPTRHVPEPVGYGNFDSLAWTPLREWQWKNARGQMAADDAAEREELEKESNADDARLAKLRRARASATLAELARSKTILFEWEGLQRKPDRSAVEAILRDAARALAKLPRNATPAAKRKVLQSTFDAMNAWNERRSVIDTPEREALIDAIDDIAHAAGLKGRDIGKKWRDW